ncbi:hypothetical protein QR721_11620 [Aciduricibacillus chroicocephali]|uniref:Uncharacterized protein n=1 Tax=Aciduricibacillus chroicocephali TaxID=3054939 RepID=A0ABY9KTY1_9BACI|nr:hypothetical protein QR721_11620 [Bacillaceae bacterium 44XB]
MSIQIKRETGLMGAASAIALKVNSNLEKKLKNKETFKIDAGAEPVKIRVNQWFFGSVEKEVEDGSTVAIKTNGLAIFIFFASLFMSVIGKNISPILTLIGFIGMVFTIIYATKQWFILEVEK